MRPRPVPRIRFLRLRFSLGCGFCPKTGHPLYRQAERMRRPFLPVSRLFGTGSGRQTHCGRIVFVRLNNWVRMAPRRCGGVSEGVIRRGGADGRPIPGKSSSYSREMQINCPESRTFASSKEAPVSRQPDARRFDAPAARCLIPRSSGTVFRLHTLSRPIGLRLPAGNAQCADGRPVRAAVGAVWYALGASACRRSGPP